MVTLGYRLEQVDLGVIPRSLIGAAALFLFL